MAYQRRNWKRRMIGTVQDAKPTSAFFGTKVLYVQDADKKCAKRVERTLSKRAGCAHCVLKLGELQKNFKTM